MAKIDDYNLAKEKSDTMRKWADKIQDKNNIDKLHAEVTIDNTYYGYYGNISVISWGDNIVREMETQMELEIRTIALHAAERLEKITEKKRTEAREEALNVLEQISDEKA